MNNIHEVLVRIEYHGQVWFEVINIEIYYGTPQQKRNPRQARGNYKQVDGPQSNEDYRV